MPRGEAAAAADVSKVREGREVVVADLREVRRDGERAAVEVVERVAVVRRARHGFHRHAAGVAGPVFEDERLPEERLEHARERPRAGFGGTPGRRADEGVGRTGGGNSGWGAGWACWDSPARAPPRSRRRTSR